MAPKDEDELADMMFTATHQRHPTFIRYPRGPAKACRSRTSPSCSKSARPRSSRILPTTAGAKWRCSVSATCARIARNAAAQLVAEGYDVAVINPRFIKPLDAGTHEFFGRAADVLVTLEDHVSRAATGRRSSNCSARRPSRTPVVRIGWPDQFIEHATTPEELRAKYGLSVENTVAKGEGAICRSAGGVKAG